MGLLLVLKLANLRILTLFTGKRLHYYSHAGVLYLRRAYSRSKSLVY